MSVRAASSWRRRRQQLLVSVLAAASWRRRRQQLLVSVRAAAAPTTITTAAAAATAEHNRQRSRQLVLVRAAAALCLHGRTHSSWHLRCNTRAVEIRRAPSLRTHARTPRTNMIPQQVCEIDARSSTLDCWRCATPFAAVDHSSATLENCTHTHVVSACSKSAEGLRACVASPMALLSATAAAELSPSEHAALTKRAAPAEEFGLRNCNYCRAGACGTHTPG